MKPNHPFFIVTALGFAAFTVSTARAESAAMAAAAASPATAPESAGVEWAEIQTCTYDERSRFFSGLGQLEARVSAQMAELTARRTAMKGDAYTKDWDFAMKELGEAQSYLRGMGEEVGKATAETWEQRKERVGYAWVRTQEAYRKVKASTTG